MRVFVGLDCGGSSTRVLAVAEDGTRLFQGSSGAANLVSTHPDKLRSHLRRAAEGCPTPHAVCGCFAGLIDEEQRNQAVSLLREIFPTARLRAEPDYVAALYASTPGTDICVVAGTGSLVTSRLASEVVKSGGGGYLLGDEGSGFRLGCAALRHYLADPATASPALRQAVEDAFHTAVESKIVSAVYQAPSPGGLIARIAKALGPDLASGLPYASAILDAELPPLAAVVRRHISLNHPNKTQMKICLAGGIWKLSKQISGRFHEFLKAEMPNIAFELVRIARAPQEGAVELAKEMTTETSVGN